MIISKLYVGAILPDMKAFMNLLKDFILSPIQTTKDKPLQIIILIASIAIIIILGKKNDKDDKNNSHIK